MLWTDLTIGDRIKFTKECIDYYEIYASDWARIVKNKVFRINNIIPIYKGDCLKIYRQL